METELRHVAFTQALVVRQLFTQAEVHGVQLSVDEGELENQKAVNDIKAYEDAQLKNPELKPDLMKLAAKQTKPILQQLNELQDANKDLQKRLSNTEKENEENKKQLAMAREAASRNVGPPSLPPMGMVQPGMPVAPVLPGGAAPLMAPSLPPAELLAPAAPATPAVDEEKAKEIAELNTKLSAMEQDLAKMKEKFEATNTELKNTKKELTVKVGETAQYQNLRKMMTKKTTELKKYKVEMKKHDPSFGDDDDEVEDGDSD